MLFRVADEVPDDQEIAGELHLLDDSRFPTTDAARTPLICVSPALASATRSNSSRRAKPSAGDMLEVTVQRISRGHIEMRKRIADFFSRNCIARQSPASASAHRVASLKTPSISSWLFTKKLVAGTSSVFILDRLAGLNAEHRVLRVRIVLAQVMAVVGGHHGIPSSCASRNRSGRILCSFGNP